MIKIENIDIYGWEAAIRGARNPMNSWSQSDTVRYAADLDPEIGPNDHRLLRNLANAGPDHGKFLRMITVTMDITAPLYWYKEFDTYKVGTVANSCSTMHKIHAKEFTLDDFSHEHMDHWSINAVDHLIRILNHNRANFVSAAEMLKNGNLDDAKRKHIVEQKKAYWWQMIQLLPSSYNQRRTVLLNYQVLKSMYHARKHHKLDEWRDFCRWVESLPYSELITGEENHNADA